MIAARIDETRCARYELEIDIAAPPERVWTAVTDQTNAWWLPDFHQVGPDSVVTFDAVAGGHLIERTPDGGSLLWYTVTCIMPGKHTVYLVGHCAPDWGGPSTTHLKLAVEPRGDGSALVVSDAYFGHVDDTNIGNTHEGWRLLFTDGLKAFVEGK
jgi:uncharacterized protein YndB with AHSA1/START domain